MVDESFWYEGLERSQLHFRNQAFARSPKENVRFILNCIHDKIFFKFTMDNFLKESWPFRNGVPLSKEWHTETVEEEERLKAVPYTLALGSVTLG